MSRLAALWLAVLAALAGAAPLATAQPQVGESSADLTLPNLGAPVNPGNPQNNSVTVRYSWGNGMTTEPTDLTLSVVEEPSWLNSTFHPSTIQINNTTESPQGNEARIVTVTLDVAPDAPAYQEGTAVYKVTAEGSQTLPPAEATEEFVVTAGFRGTVSVQLPKGDNVTAWGGTVTKIPLEITNEANGPLIVDVTVARFPADAIVTPPLEVEVPAGQGNNTKTTNLEVQVPWTVSVDGPVIVELSPSHAEKGTPARTVETRFQLNGNSAVPVPGPGPWATLAVAGAALLIAQRRRS